MESIGFNPKSPYKTLVLGTPYAGKTVFLSSLYKRLSIAQPQLGTDFYLNTTEGTKLLSIYHQMEAEKKWPERTADFQTYLFALRTNITTKDANGNPQTEACDHLAYQFCDIPGQSLTDEKTDPEWVKRVDDLGNDADNLLVLIDGLTVLKAINNEGGAGLYSQLDFILPIVERLPGKPLHFVITKWDLVENHATEKASSSEQLCRARAKFELHHGFRSIIQQQTQQKIPTRLIPISAVGNKFAVLDNDQMSINPNGSPEPVRVELPIALTLWDGLSLARRQVSDDLKSKQSTLGNIVNFKRLVEVFGQFVDKIPLPDYYAVGKVGLGSILSLLKTILEKLIPLKEKEIDKLSLQDQHLLKVLNEFSALVDNLEIKFPASALANK